MSFFLEKLRTWKLKQASAAIKHLEKQASRNLAFSTDGFVSKLLENFK